MKYYNAITTPKQLSDIVEVSIATVYDWIRKNKVQYSTILGSKVFSREQVEWIVENKNKIYNSQPPGFKGVPVYKVSKSKLKN